MLIDIDKIVVGDRIRKDFGDIEELAESIKKNGLFNPITINNRYKLLAGERRLRACKLLGWSQVDVRMVESEDEAQDIEIELSENTVRRNFTGSELAEGIRRQMEIEAAKAKERMQDPMQTFAEGQKGTARDKAAEQFGISGEQARKTLYVADNADMLDPADFADWDEGKLSTNKAYQRIKAAQKQAEKERDDAEHDAAELMGKLSDLRDEVAALEKQNDELYELANTQQVIEHEVVRTVAPEDYEDVKKRLRELEGSNRLYSEDNSKLREQLETARKELEQSSNSDAIIENAKRDAKAFLAKYSGVSELIDVFAAMNEFLTA